ncbi:hypothetical protein FT663_03014 [Candidozyma haemuli var. vulneris]|uniref:CFEM domain-containing protein n=1 Tax=Candidozyma haemuli TaxID=45357 RepID=A0A2V1B2S2_9ASCO|nr:hypothetical protein CXQ85_004095 [[Candida] haemuloni]KAF3989080.1 hypothetical protein FT662_03054 [[Candida] haemuloni var. vulneris]KAF3990850.1 hypothetical protein FT663_03014 [[Candida] haemuloni var. vulneris]PVH23801.1 hypothetical protein CXQ85_004095 [[Candida] haemuloni]
MKLSTTAILAFASTVLADNWSTYPAVPKTASINGLADPINDKLPECAKECFAKDTSSTPCPYWDTGCLCVMSPWTQPVGTCVAEKCKGDDVKSATSLAISACKSAGVWDPYFIVGDEVSSLLASAADVSPAVTPAP